MYNPYNIPNLDNFTELNNLVAPAYAWYWSKTGDDTYLNEGDLLFSHTFDNPAAYAWSGKQFSQIFKWSFDYVNWRSGTATSTTVQANNPYAGAYADTEPPIEYNVKPGTIGRTSVTITWSTYEKADTQAAVGLTKQYSYYSPVLDQGDSMKTSHGVSVPNLSPNTTYHFQVRSKDAAGNFAGSCDYTFKTLP